ncbi:MAG: phage terminase, small subunit, putative, family [Phycisphaerales bacterium]|nr:phage terminase, small subunit, putative, family [Phycisphaerales bacterium]
MGRRGPPPKPTALKIAEGNPGHEKINRLEPRPDVAAPNRPAWLTERAAAEWVRVVPELLSLGLLTRVDLAALACYCEAVSDLQGAIEMLAADGPTIDADSGYKLPHPAVAMKRAAMQAVRQFAAEFGLSPAARSRVAAPPPAKANPLAAFQPPPSRPPPLKMAE